MISRNLIIFFILLNIINSIPILAKEDILSVDTKIKSIAVKEIVSDEMISQRLNNILNAVGTYKDVQIKVISGVVILSGQVEEDSQIEWIQNLTQRMDGVVVVQNQLKTRPKDLLDFTPAREELDTFNVTIMRHLPIIVLALIVLTFSILLFFLTSFGLKRAFVKKIPSPLLLNATAKVLSIPVFLLGLYLALRISGLAGLAFTVLGGTGLLGLAIGLGLKK